jgi:hypothetical protein
MQITLRRSTLLNCFVNGGHINLPDVHRPGQWFSGIIQKLEREDGSGRNFNVYFGSGPKDWTFIRTVLD